MNIQKQIQYLEELQEKLGAAKHHLWCLEKGLYKEHSSFDTKARWKKEVNTLEAELAKLQSEQIEEAETPNLKEEVADFLHQLDVKINGNTVQVVEVKPEPGEVETVSKLTKDVKGVGEVKATYELNTNPISVGGMVYREREIIRFSSPIGNASYDLTTQNWLATPGGMRPKDESLILEAFQNDLNRLGPAPQSDPLEPEIPAIQIVDLEELTFWEEYIEKNLKFFKDNGRLRMGWEPGNTCYKYFKQRLDRSFSLGYSERLSFLKQIAGEMYCRKQLRESLNVFREEIQKGINMIEQFERRES